MEQEKIQEWLLSQAEQKYRSFSAGLLPGVENLLGIRLPVLRKKAKELAREDWKSCMQWQEFSFFEEIMLQGMVLGYAKAPTEEILEHAGRFIPRINNWSVNDSFCYSFKIAKVEQEKVWDFLMHYKDSKETYEVRVVAVMLLIYYLNDQFIDRVLSVLGQLYVEKYYASMAVAWAYAAAWANYPKKTREYLIHHPIDSETYRRTLQKCLESHQISGEEKNWIRKERERAKDLHSGKE